MLEKMLYSDKCTGCKMCSQICPVSAISFAEDETGFWYPRVDDNKCIQCGLCEKKCPGLHPVKSVKEQPEVYAVWAKDKKIRLNSTSGGVCHELSRCVIEEGGYVAGVVYAQDFKSAHYILINDENGLKKITQTKYFQADADGIYEKVKKKLEEGKTVLFVGTPCYNAALQSYLGKEYENLIQCEFVCRGNPSPKLHRMYIEHLEKLHASPVVQVHAKNKRKGWSCFGRYIRFENGDEYYKDRYHEPMTIMFSGRGINMRNSCFSCQYRKIPRVADVTVGDFWGIQGVSEDDLFHGVSLLMVNSEKGRLLLRTAEKYIEHHARTVEDVLKGNPALLRNLEKTDAVKKFQKDVNMMSFAELQKKYAPPGWKRRCRKALSRGKRILSLAVSVSLVKFVHYNFLSRKIVRKRHAYLIPYRGTCISIGKGGKVYLEGSFLLNEHKMKGSRAECYLKVADGARLTVKEKSWLGYNSTLQVNAGAELEIGQMSANIGCNIQCSNRITLGRNVMIGRDVMIYDSDYHRTGINRKKMEVTIGDHVWIGSRAMIMKGSRIENGAIVSANAWVMGKVKERTLVAGTPAKRLLDEVEWER